MSDQNMATKLQCYKDREDYSRRSSSLLCDYNLCMKRIKKIFNECNIYFSHLK